MWTVKLSRRDFFELALSGPSTAVLNSVREEIGFPAFTNSRDSIIACWPNKPSDNTTLPILAVIPDSDTDDFFAALNASPQAPTPFTALCRVLTVNEARSYTEMHQWPLSEKVSQGMISLSLVEAYLHAEGRISIQEISPAACKRTFSYVWAKAIAANIPPSALEDLPDNWINTYRKFNTPIATESIYKTVSAAISVLSVATELCAGKKPSTEIGNLCYALLNGDKVAQEMAWERLSYHLPITISLKALSLATREERGAYLQAALQQISSSHPSEYGAVGCAFLATQVAPATLVHLNLLLKQAGIDTVFWYALLANFQTPYTMLSTNISLARRLSKFVALTETLDTSPTSDLAYNELKIITKNGIEDISRKLSHSNELEIELIPLVSGAFRFPRKSSQSNEETQSLLPLHEVERLRVQSPREKYMDAIGTLAELSQFLPENFGDESIQKSKKATKSRKRE